MILYYDNGFSKLVDRRRVGTNIDTGNKAADVIVSTQKRTAAYPFVCCKYDSKRRTRSPNAYERSTGGIYIICMYIRYNTGESIILKQKKQTFFFFPSYARAIQNQRP